MKQILSPRDVILFELEQDLTLVSAVDSCGGIGNQSHDALNVDPEIVGMFTARVALLEIVAAGAKPAFASLAVCSGPQTAAPIIAGVKKILGESFPLIISTEKNMPTSETGIGVTITGFCKTSELLVARAQSGDVLYCAGYPLVGGETVQAGAQTFNAEHFKALLRSSHFHTLIPVGSMGIAAEAELLARESSLQCNFSSASGVDLKKSAGPSTCAVFAADSRVQFDIGLPVFEIGTLY